MKDPGQTLDQCLSESHDVQARFFQENRSRILATAQLLAERLRDGGKILFFGNGGSAADAQHLAAEFVGRFIPDRPALAALSLVTDTSVLTSVGNDYGFEHVFSRQIEAIGRPADVAVAISTSGNSPNVIAGIDAARKAAIYTVGLTGEDGGRLAGRVDTLFCVPSRRTPRIQETHILLGHTLAEIVDRILFPDTYQ